MPRTKRSTSTLILVACVLAALAMAILAAFGRADSAADGPMVGEPAPPLTIESWLKGEPLADLQPGWVYVIDIWAPWCGPCIGSMPHLSELEERYRDRRFAVIGLTGDDDYGSTRERAVAQVASQGERIRYRIAWDQARATYNQWMAREQASGWPWAFIVDRDRKVAWIGHPSGMDPVLERVIAGTWNRDSAATAYRHRAQGMDLGNAFYTAYRAEKNQDAIARYATLQKFDADQAAGYAPHYFKLLLLRERRRDDAYAFVLTELDRSPRNRPGELVRIATMAADTTTPPPLRDLDVALACAQRAAEVSPNDDPGTQETLARVHAVRGEWKQAVTVQERAIAQSDSSGAVTRGVVLQRYRSRKL